MVSNIGKTVTFYNVKAKKKKKKCTQWIRGIVQEVLSYNVDHVNRLQFAALEKVQESDELRRELASV